jgi:hypothetical protein
MRSEIAIVVGEMLEGPSGCLEVSAHQRAQGTIAPSILSLVWQDPSAQ